MHSHLFLHGFVAASAVTLMSCTNMDTHTATESRAGCHSPPSTAAATDLDTTTPPLVNLGTHAHPVTTVSKRAQRYFNQGLIQMYAFNHQEAIRAFHEVLRLDPNCAMAWWGIALSYGPNINQVMEDAAVPKAWEALQKAKALASKASEKERDYIAALEKRYVEKPVADRSAFDKAYAGAMLALAKKYPDDVDAATLAAEAVMDTMPWDYWGSDGKLKPLAAEASTLLERVLNQEPNHPGANHYYIHVVEAVKPGLALDAAKRLEALKLDAGHLVHMPSHIYLRVGMYEESAEVNRRAIEADHGYVAACRLQGYYPATYIPHNIHFLWYAQLMMGQSKEALVSARETARYVIDKVPNAIEAQRQRTVPALTLARFEQWAEVLKEPVSGDDYLFAKGMSRYARCLAFAGLGRIDDAKKEYEAVRAIATSEKARALNTPVLPGHTVLQLAVTSLEAVLADAAGDVETAVSKYARAVEMEDALPYMEPPFWHHPVRQSFGNALLRFKRPAEAEKVFRADLERNPKNGYSLHGLARSLRAQGQADEAEKVEKELAAAWKNADFKLAKQ